MSRFRATEPRFGERGLENSEGEFAAQYAEYAVQGQLYPSREGSPLLEFAAAGRVLYLFDRMGPYTSQAGPARVIVHGILEVEEIEPLAASHEPPKEVLTVLGISSVEGVGRVLHVSRRTWVVQARVPLVLSAFDPLPDVVAGDWVSFKTVPPLHGFVLGERSGLGPKPPTKVS